MSLPPPPQIVRVLTPSISDCDLIWKQGLYRCNQVKMRSLGWVQIHYEQHPYQKGKLNTDMCTGRTPSEREGGNLGDVPTRHQTSGISRKAQESGREAQSMSSSSPSEGAYTAGTLTLDF